MVRDFIGIHRTLCHSVTEAPLFGKIIFYFALRCTPCCMGLDFSPSDTDGVGAPRSAWRLRVHCVPCNCPPLPRTRALWGCAQPLLRSRLTVPYGATGRMRLFRSQLIKIFSAASSFLIALTTRRASGRHRGRSSPGAVREHPGRRGAVHPGPLLDVLCLLHTHLSLSSSRVTH